MKKTPAKKKVKVRKVNRKALAHRAEAQFNLYIRLRDCKAETGGFSQGRCITCDKILPFEKLQAGHCVHDSANTSRAQFDERNVHTQCAGCNTFNHGRLDLYASRLINWYGESIVDDLHALKHQSLTNDELQNIITVYKSKVENILIGG